LTISLTYFPLQRITIVKEIERRDKENVNIQYTYYGLHKGVNFYKLKLPKNTEYTFRI